MQVRKIIRNDRGDPIRLDSKERAVARYWQRRVNAIPALGFTVDIGTLTAISRKVVEQKFYTIPIADYVPIRVGENPFSIELLTWMAFRAGGDFENGLIDTAGDDSKLASADAGVAPIKVPVKNWAKKCGWDLFQINYSAKFGNWDVVEQKLKARKENWDLGIQRTAFLGLKSMANMTGLLTLPTGGGSLVTYDNTTITSAISTMDTATYTAFLGEMLEKYRVGTGRTLMPNRFAVPESDYNGLMTPVSATFPFKSKLQLLNEVLREVTQDPGFKVFPTAYAMASNSGGALAVDRYALYRYDDESLRMDIPVDYTATLQNTIDGFHFANVGYGQFSGVNTYRQGAVMYFDLDAV